MSATETGNLIGLEISNLMKGQSCLMLVVCRKVSMCLILMGLRSLTQEKALSILFKLSGVLFEGVSKRLTGQ